MVSFCFAASEETFFLFYENNWSIVSRVLLVAGQECIVSQCSLCSVKCQDADLLISLGGSMPSRLHEAFVGSLLFVVWLARNDSHLTKTAETSQLETFQ